MGRITTVILAGGKGERLRPITNTLPKPMALIGNKPLLQYIINYLKKYSVTDIIITVCYHADIIKNYFGNGKKFNVNISYVTEDKNNPLGTAGALSLLVNKLKTTFIVCSGDILQKINIRDIIAFHKKKGGIATICVYKNLKSDPKSMIKFDRNNRILSFIERPRDIPADGVWANASFYVFEPEIFPFIPYNEKSDFGKDIFPRLIESSKKIYAYAYDDYFLDIGNLEKLKKANLDIKKI